MATTTFHYRNGQGSGNTDFTYDFSTVKEEDVKVRVSNVLVDNFTIPNYAKTGTQTIRFDNTTGTLNSTVCDSDGSPKAGTNNVYIFRDTDVDSRRVTYTEGSSLKAESLNNQSDQLLYALQEEQNQLLRRENIEDLEVVTAAIGNDAVSTAKIANDAVTYAKIQNVSATDRVLGRDTAGAGDIEEITPANLRTMINVEDGSTADQTVGEIKALLASDNLTAAHLASDSVGTSELQNDSVTKDQLANSIVTEIEANTDKVTNANHSGDVSGSTTLTIGNDVVTYAKMQNVSATDRVLGRDSSGAGNIEEITPANLRAMINVEDGATADQTASEIKTLFNSNKLQAQQLDADSVETDQIKDQNVTTAKLAEEELRTIAAMHQGTASILGDSSSPLQATISEINSICENRAAQTSITDDDAKIPTSGAVVDFVASQIAPIGGLEVIADDQKFPFNQPDSGVVISIADAGGLDVNGSGTSTTAKTLTGPNGESAKTVTINNINSSYNSSIVTNGVGFLVSSTGSGDVYNFHKSVIRDQDILSISSDINDFANRYRVGSSNPTSSLDAGDLFYNTTTNKLLVFNATDSAWEETQAVGNFFVNTISSFSGTGGNSSTFNGSAFKFVLSNAPTLPQQLIVSINGVIQKPNSGTDQPSEGFALDGSTIIFGAAPPTNSPFFIITIGASVNIGTPSNNTVNAACLQTNAVTTVKIDADAVDGTKIANDAVGAEHIEVLDDELQFGDDVKAQFGAGNDIEIFHKSSDQSAVIQNVNDTGFLRILSGDSNSSGILLKNRDDDVVYIRCKNELGTEIFHENNVKFETISAGVKITGNNLILNDSGAFFIDHPTTGQVVNFRVSNSSSNDTTALTLLSDGMNSHADNIKSAWGTGNDLQIFHDGTDDVIHSTGTSLRTRSNIFRANNAANSAVLFRATAGGNFEAFHDGTKKIETSSGGVNIHEDTDKVVSFSGGIGEIGSVPGFQGSNTAGDSLTSLGMRGTDLRFATSASERMRIDSSGNVLIGTTSVVSSNLIDGSTAITPTLHLEGTGSSGNTSGVINLSRKTGAGGSLIYSSGDDGGLCLRNTDDNGITLLDGTSKAVRAVHDGAVELYHNGTKTFQTETNGATFMGPEGSAGWIQIFSDEGDDNGDKWRLIKDGGSEEFLIQNFKSGSWETNIQTTGEGNVELNYDNSRKFKTESWGTTITGQSFVGADLSSNYAGKFRNDGDTTTRWGVEIQCGKDDASGTNFALWIVDGDGTDQGGLSFSGGTVSLVAFTAAHPAEVPNSDNPSDDSPAYPYGTLVETTAITYSKKADGTDTERGIIYKVQKTQSANSRKILGAYSGNMRGGPAGRTNDHEITVVGDGHILCNNAGGNIEIGDGICSSSTAGIGQKATVNPSMIIGIAQEDVTFTGSETKLVPVQFGLQQFIPWT